MRKKLKTKKKESVKGEASDHVAHRKKAKNLIEDLKIKEQKDRRLRKKERKKEKKQRQKKKQPATADEIKKRRIKERKWNLRFPQNLNSKL